MVAQAKVEDGAGDPVAIAATLQQARDQARTRGRGEILTVQIVVLQIIRSHARPNATPSTSLAVFSQLQALRGLADRLLEIQAHQKGTDTQAALRQLINSGKESLKRLDEAAIRLRPALEAATESARQPLSPATVGECPKASQCPSNTSRAINDTLHAHAPIAERAWAAHEARAGPDTLAPVTAIKEEPPSEFAAWAPPAAPGSTLEEVLSNAAPLFGPPRSLTALSADLTPCESASSAAYVRAGVPGVLTAVIGLGDRPLLGPSLVIVSAQEGAAAGRRPLQPSTHAVFQELTQTALQWATGSSDAQCSPLELLLLWLALHVVWRARW